MAGGRGGAGCGGGSQSGGDRGGGGGGDSVAGGWRPGGGVAEPGAAGAGGPGRDGVGGRVRGRGPRADRRAGLAGCRWRRSTARRRRWSPATRPPVSELVAACAAAGVRARVLPVDYASHGRAGGAAPGGDPGRPGAGDAGPGRDPDGVGDDRRVAGRPGGGCRVLVRQPAGPGRVRPGGQVLAEAGHRVVRRGVPASGAGRRDGGRRPRGDRDAAPRRRRPGPVPRLAGEPARPRRPRRLGRGAGRRAADGAADLRVPARALLAAVGSRRPGGRSGGAGAWRGESSAARRGGGTGRSGRAGADRADVGAVPAVAGRSRGGRGDGAAGDGLRRYGPRGGERGRLRPGRRADCAGAADPARRGGGAGAGDGKRTRARRAAGRGGVRPARRCVRAVDPARQRMAGPGQPSGRPGRRVRGVAAARLGTGGDRGPVRGAGGGRLRVRAVVPRVAGGVAQGRGPVRRGGAARRGGPGRVRGPSGAARRSSCMRSACMRRGCMHRAGLRRGCPPRAGPGTPSGRAR